MLGSAPSGRSSSLRLLRVAKDGTVIEAAREDASEIVDRDPELADPPVLRAATAARLPQERAEFLERT